MQTLDTMLFIGTYDTVAANDKKTGKEIWKTSLAIYNYSIVSVILEDNKLYAGTYAKLFILDPYNGKILAKNDLKGRGYNFPSMITCKAQTQIHKRSLTPNNLLNEKYVFLAFNGYFLAIDKDTCEIIWELKYKKFFNGPASILYDEDKVYVGVSGEVHCIDLNDRKILWTNKLKSLGYSCVSLINNEDKIFVGIYGNVLGLDKMNGNELWRKTIPGAYSYPVLYYEENILYAGMSARLVKMQPDSGDIITNDELKDQGNGYFNIATIHTEKNSFPFLLRDNLSFLYEQPPFYPQINSNSSTDYKKKENNLISIYNDINNISKNDDGTNFFDDNVFSFSSPFVSTAPPYNPELFPNTNRVSNKNIDEFIFTALNAHICGIHKKTGLILWKTKLTSFDEQCLPTSIVFSSGRLYVGAQGMIYCLDAFTGNLIWKNEVNGLRSCSVSIITSTNNNTILFSSPSLWYSFDSY